MLAINQHQMFKKTEKTKAYQEIVAQVEMAILSGDLTPGQKLPPERDLIDTFGISRNTLREALRVLEQKGLITVKTGQKGGIVVKKVDTKQLSESLAFLIRHRRVSLTHLAEFREGLEGNISALAAKRAKVADIQHLTDILNQMEDEIEKDLMSILQLDKSFHLTLAAITGNPVFLTLLKVIYNNIHQYYSRLYPKESRYKWEIYQDLREIADAVRCGNAIKARQLTKRHIYRSNTYLKQQEEREHASKSITLTEPAWTYSNAAKPYSGQTIKIIGPQSHSWNVLSQLKHEFEDLTGIQVEMLSVHIDHFDSEVKKPSNTWDAVSLLSFQICDYASSNLILEIDSLFELPLIQDPSFDPRRDIHPAVWRTSCVWQDKYFGITHEITPPLLCHRKDLTQHPEEKKCFKEKYGYTLPETPETFMEYYDLVEFFNRKKGQKLGGKKLASDFYGTVLSPYLPLIDDYSNLLYAMGGQVISPDHKIETDSLLNITALEYLLSLGKFTPSNLKEYSTEDQFSAFTNGSVFSHLIYCEDFHWIENPSKSRVAGRVGYSLPPEKGKVFPYAYSWCVASASPRKEAVWLWLQWVSSYEIQKQIQLLGGATPRLDVMHDSDVLKKPYMSAVIETFEHLVEEPSTPHGMAMYKLIKNEIAKAAEEPLTPKQALRTAAKKQREFLKQ